MKKKKVSERMIYFYFGLSAVFFVIGVFVLFNYYAHMPDYIAAGINASKELHSSKLVVQKPPFPFYGIYMAVAGAIIFLTTKYFYTKK